MRPRRPKHTATRKKAVEAGYRSGLEKGIATDLVERGVEFEYEKHRIMYLLPVRGASCLSCGETGRVGKRATYTPDFRLNPKGVEPFFVESKGYFTGKDRTKLLAIKLQFPEVDLRILFAADNWCTKRHKQRYSEWAAKNGFRFAVGKRIPDSWLQGGGRSVSDE